MKTLPTRFAVALPVRLAAAALFLVVIVVQAQDVCPEPPSAAAADDTRMRVRLAVQGFAAEGRPLVTLWPGGAPGAKGTRAEDTPQMAAFVPEKPNGAAVIVCPGGGYRVLATNYEGRQIALALNRSGVTAFVLFYRLGSHGYHHPAQLEDAQCALRWVRAHSAEWRLDPARVGIMGFCAADHLAAMASTRFDDGRPDAAGPVERQSSRPDFTVLCYPVISLAVEANVRNTPVPSEMLLGDRKMKVLYSVLDLPGRPAPAAATDGTMVATRRAPGDAEELTIDIGASRNVVKLELISSR